MKKLVLYFAILSVSICIPALSHAAPALENYSGTVSSFHANFTYVNPATSKLKTIALTAKAPRGAKNAELSRDTATNTIGPVNEFLTNNAHGLIVMTPSNLAITSSRGMTLSNVEMEILFWDGTVGFDPNTFTWSGTGNVYVCITGGLLTFVPASSGTNAVLKVTKIAPAESFIVNFVDGVEGSEIIPAMAANVTMPAIPMKKVTP
jgi:hypothetical protein